MHFFMEHNLPMSAADHCDNLFRITVRICFGICLGTQLQEITDLKPSELQQQYANLPVAQIEPSVLKMERADKQLGLGVNRCKSSGN